jgi:small-conductance mechanosensitive channel
MMSDVFMMLDNKIISSLVFLFVALLLRWLVIYFLKKRPEDEEGLSRRWINSFKNITIFIIFLGLLIIWLSELRFVALSIAAFAVAIVLAIREFIQCLLGHIFLATTGSFRVGDWISTGNLVGEVVSNDWLSTSLLEVEIEDKSYTYTGKTIFIPNSQFASAAIKNLNYMRRYVEHSFSITCDPEKVSKENLCNANELILETAQAITAEFQEVAKRYNSMIEKRMGVKLQGTDASVRVSTSNLGNIIFTISIFCPTQKALVIEQNLTRYFIEYLYSVEPAN